MSTTTTDTSPASIWRQHTLAALFYLALAIWMTWPQAAVLGDAIVGGPIAQSDGWQKVWNIWWLQYAFTHGTDPFYTNLLFWPQGARSASNR
ncbi:MAG: hypothetical protein HC914_07710 [Chloroflexaceae bacterium]|nr:hypothetical protein [Chloroflexaceae bacterium]